VLNVQDVMTDMTAYASEELHLSSVKAVSVHAGMLNAARNIRQRLVGNAHFMAVVQLFYGLVFAAVECPQIKIHSETVTVKGRSHRVHIGAVRTHAETCIE